MPQTQAAARFSTARSRLLIDQPFFGALALNLRAVPDETKSTLAVDGSAIYYNPRFFMELSMELCSSAIAHEVMHCVLEHTSRLQMRNPRKWNQACDYAANAILKEANLPLGENWLHNPQWKDKSADEIYTLLPDGDKGDDPLDEILPGPEGQSAENLAVEWKLATVQAARQAKSQGRLPGQLQKILDDTLAPEIPWRDVLACFMAERVKNDYSFRRPNPYYAHGGLYLPIIDGIGMGEIVIAIDTSGSVINILDEFGATVASIVDNVKPLRTHVIYCDSAINRVDVFDRGQALTLRAAGGGGTDFRPVFDHVKDNSIQPACLLYLTDMYGTFPQQKPDYPVLWCATEDIQGPFGETLRIKG